MNSYHSERSKKIGWLSVILVSLLSLFLYKVLKISACSSAKSQRQLIVLNVPDTELYLHHKYDGFEIERATNVKVFEGDNARNAKTGNLLEDGALLILGKNRIYELVKLKGWQDWRTVFWRKLDNINEPVTIGTGKTCQILIDAKDVPDDHRKQKYISLMVGTGKVLTAQANIQDIRINRNKKIYNLTTKNFAVMSGDIIEGPGSYRFRAQVVTSLYTDERDSNYLRRGSFLKVEALEKNDTQRIHGKIGWTLVWRGYHEERDIPLLTFNEEGGDGETIILPSSKDILITGSDSLLGIIKGKFIPEYCKYDDLIGAFSKYLINTSKNRGFALFEDSTMAALKIPFGVKAKLETLGEKFNQMRSPVGLLVSGAVRYRGTDGLIHEQEINGNSGWKSVAVSQERWFNADFNSNAWQNVASPWPYHPPIHLYRDTEFSGLPWIWHREGWHPQFLPPAGKIERFFRLVTDIPGEVLKADFAIIGDSEWTVYVNGKFICTRRWGDSGKLSLPLKKGVNLIAVKTTKFMPKDSTDGVYLPFKKDISMEMERVKHLPINRLPSRLNRGKRLEGGRGNILDTDGVSINRVVVEKGNFLVAEGTEVFLDNIHPKLRKGGAEGMKRIIFLKESGKRVNLFSDTQVKAAYEKTGDICTEGNIERYYAVSEKDEGLPPMASHAGRKVCLRKDRESITWSGGTKWLQYNAYPGKLLPGDIIIVDHVSGRLHQLEIKDFGLQYGPEPDVPIYLDVYVSKDGSGNISSRIKGRGIVVHGAEKSVNPENYPLRTGDIIEVVGEGITLRFEDSKGVLANNRKKGNKSERTHQKHAGLGTVVGCGETGLEKVFDEVLTRKKDVRTTIDDDAQRFGQLELERAVHIARTADAHRGADPEKFYEGALTAIDADTGSIIVLASTPAVECGGRRTLEAMEYDRVQSEKSSIRNRCIHSLFPPGSTFKLIPGIAASSLDGPGTEAVTRMMNGHPPREYMKGNRNNLLGKEIRANSGKTTQIRFELKNVHGKQDNGPFNIQEELKVSNNTYFGYLGALLYKPVREGEFYRTWQSFASKRLIREFHPVLYYAEAFGYNTRFRLLPDDVFQNRELTELLNLSSKDILVTERSVFPSYSTDLHSLVKSAVGQDEVRTTPLHQALVIELIANDGIGKVPYLIQEIVGAPLTQKDMFRVDAPVDAFKRIKEGMRKAVREPGGTAYNAFKDSPIANLVYGKTGTAERGKEGKIKNDSWFVGYVQPKNWDPNSPDTSRHRIAFACVLPDTGFGGAYAADTVERFLRRLSRYFQWVE